MVAAAKKDANTDGGQYKKPDAARAFEIYDKQIKPKKAQLDTIRGDLSDPYSLIKDQCNYPRKVLDFIVALEGEEDAKRDHMLLALSQGLALRKLYLPRDLVTMASGTAGAEIVPSGERPKPVLATIMPSDGSETDLTDAADTEPNPIGTPNPFEAAATAEADEPFEAPAEELAKQAGRGTSRKKADKDPAHGTSAAAIAAMNTKKPDLKAVN